MKSKLRTGILAVLGIMLIFSVPLMANTEEEPVEFQNRDVELAIKQQLGKAMGDVYPSDLKELKQLMIKRKNLEDLEWIKYCENLERLNFTDSEIKDLSSLSNLTNLERLVLVFNDISDLSPLSKLYSLEYVVIAGNPITDIQPLVDNFKVKENGEKIGLGESDEVNITRNKLDLSEGSDALQDIQTLIDRGVEVEYYPQKEESS